MTDYIRQKNATLSSNISEPLKFVNNRCIEILNCKINDVNNLIDYFNRIVRLESRLKSYISKIHPQYYDRKEFNAEVDSRLFKDTIEFTKEPILKQFLYSLSISLKYRDIDTQNRIKFHNQITLPQLSSILSHLKRVKKSYLNYELTLDEKLQEVSYNVNQLEKEYQSYAVEISKIVKKIRLISTEENKKATEVLLAKLDMISTKLYRTHNAYVIALRTARHITDWIKSNLQPRIIKDLIFRNLQSTNVAIGYLIKLAQDQIDSPKSYDSFIDLLMSSCDPSIDDDVLSKLIQNVNDGIDSKYEFSFNEKLLEASETKTIRINEMIINESTYSQIDELLDFHKNKLNLHQNIVMGLHSDLAQWHEALKQWNTVLSTGPSPVVSKYDLRQQYDLCNDGTTFTQLCPLNQNKLDRLITEDYSKTSSAIEVNISISELEFELELAVCQQEMHIMNFDFVNLSKSDHLYALNTANNNTNLNNTRQNIQNNPSASSPIYGSGTSTSLEESLSLNNKNQNYGNSYCLQWDSDHYPSDANQVTDENCPTNITKESIKNKLTSKISIIRSSLRKKKQKRPQISNAIRLGSKSLDSDNNHLEDVNEPSNVDMNPEFKVESDCDEVADSSDSEEDDPNQIEVKNKFFDMTTVKVVGHGLALSDDQRSSFPVNTNNNDNHLQANHLAKSNTAKSDQIRSNSQMTRLLNQPGGDDLVLISNTKIDGNKRSSSETSISASVNKEPWFHGVLPRSQVDKLLLHEGEFLIRETTKSYSNHTSSINSNNGTNGSRSSKKTKKNLVLSVFWNGEVRHFIIKHEMDKTTNKLLWSIEGPKFPNIGMFLEHLMTNQIPVTKASNIVIKTPVARPNWQLNNSDVQLMNKIGQGNFGEVYRGIFNAENVAVKICRADATEFEVTKKFLAGETTALNFQHPNIVQLIGIAVRSYPIMIVMEYVENGSLLSYLRDPKNDLNVDLLARMSSDAAAGMTYLESKQCIHRDLAARNCLVTKHIRVKIADFGMSRENDVYVLSNCTDQIPIKWTAPEALKTGRYTIKCDIWSYGVLLWEIFSLGKTPYNDMDNKRTRDFIDKGYRLSKPDRMTEWMNEIMQSCWRERPSERPSFKDINDTFINKFGNFQITENGGHKPSLQRPLLRIPLSMD